MFSSMKSHQSGASPCDNVNLFIEWYKITLIMIPLKNLKHKDVLHVKFKDFVINFDKENLEYVSFWE